eukprot:g77080.t1
MEVVHMTGAVRHKPCLLLQTGNNTSLAHPRMSGWSASGLCASNDVTGVAPSSLSSASSTFDSDGRPESGRLKLSDSWPVAQTLLKRN